MLLFEPEKEERLVRDMLLGHRNVRLEPEGWDFVRLTGRQNIKLQNPRPKFRLRSF